MISFKLNTNLKRKEITLQKENNNLCDEFLHWMRILPERGTIILPRLRCENQQKPEHREGWRDKRFWKFFSPFRQKYIRDISRQFFLTENLHCAYRSEEVWWSARFFLQIVQKKLCYSLYPKVRDCMAVYFIGCFLQSSRRTNSGKLAVICFLS